MRELWLGERTTTQRTAKDNNSISTNLILLLLLIIMLLLEIMRCYVWVLACADQSCLAPFFFSFTRTESLDWWLPPAKKKKRLVTARWSPPAPNRGVRTTPAVSKSARKHLVSFLQTHGLAEEYPFFPLLALIIWARSCTTTPSSVLILY